MAQLATNKSWRYMYQKIPALQSQVKGSLQSTLANGLSQTAEVQARSSTGNWKILQKKWLKRSFGR